MILQIKKIWSNPIIALGISIILLCISFYDPLLAQVHEWNSDEYSYGYIVPFLAILIAWHRLAEKPPQLNPSSIGFVVVLGGALLLVVSHLSAFQPPAHYGFVMALTGLSLAFCGRAFTRTIVPALILLVFAIPLPRLIYVTLSANLQAISSSLSALVLHQIGIPVFQEGNIIDLGVYKLQVVEGCSGLRYLFPLMCFGYIISYLYNDVMWKRVLLFLSSIPITIFMNSFRIAVIGITVNYWGIAAAEGFLHAFEGWVVFVLCIFLLLLEMKVLIHLGRRVPPGYLRLDIFSLPRGTIASPGGSVGAWQWATLALCAVLCGLTLSRTLVDRTEMVPNRTPFIAFPSILNGWQATPLAISEDELKELRLSDYYLADFRNDEDHTTVNLYIAYYESQRTNSSIHSPSNCIPSGGWAIMSEQIIPVPVNSMTIPVTRLMIAREKSKLLVYYWFQGRGRILNDQYAAKWFLLVDSIKKKRTDGALIRLSTTMIPDEPEEKADRRLRTMMESFFPIIDNYVPGLSPPDMR
jgi:exosortase D (VPLPA-CTERM-specific)